MSCNPEVIASSSIGSVVSCPCGNVTVNIGNASINIPKERLPNFQR